MNHEIASGAMMVEGIRRKEGQNPVLIPLFLDQK